MNREQFFVDSELYDNLDSNYNSLLIKYQKQKELINKAIAIYEKCIKTQDFSTCDLEMYEVLKEVSE